SAARSSLDQLLVIALDQIVIALGRQRALLLHRLEQVLAEPLGRAVLVGARDPDRLVADRAFLGLAGGAARAVARLGERVGGGAGRGARARRVLDPQALLGGAHLVDRAAELLAELGAG